MEIAIGVFFLAVIGGAILLFFGLMIFLWRRRAKRRNSGQSKNFVGNSTTDGDTDFYENSTDYRGNSAYTDSSVIIPAAVGAVVGAQIAENYQENNNAGGNWEYTAYENSDSAVADSGIDGGSTCSSSDSSSDSSSSCSSCGGGSD